MEKETALPKNVRQIGDIQGNQRIYMEDYVVTYIHRKEKQEEKEGFLGVFLGEMQKSEGETRLFIRGLMNIPLDRWEEKPEDEADGKEAEKTVTSLKKRTGKDENGSGKKTAGETENRDTDWDTESWEKENDWETIKNTESKEEGAESAEDPAMAGGPSEDGVSIGQTKKRRKRTVQEECRDYFGDLEILGCCVVGRYQVEPMKKLIEEVPQSRRLLYHLQEQEERLYWTETGKYEEISGYFVFYEQNRKMQEYMSESFGEKEEEKEKITDQAIKAFREKIKKKDQMQTAGIMKLASSFFVVTVLIVGAIVVTRAGKIRDSSGGESTLIKTTVQDGGSVYGTERAAEKDGFGIDGTAAVSGSTVTGDTAPAESVSAGGGAAGLPGSGTVDGAAGLPGSGAADGAAGLPGSENAGGTAVSSGDGIMDSAAVSSENGVADSAAGLPESGTADGAAALSGSGAVDDMTTVSGGGAVDDTTTASGSEVLDSTAVSSAGGSAGEAAAASGNGVTDEAAAASGNGATDEAAAVSGNGAAGEAAAVSGSGALDDTTAASGGSAAVTAGSGTAGDMEAAADSAVAASQEDVNVSDDTIAADDPAVQEDVEASAPVRQLQSSYVIREGDTLADICQKYYGNLNKLEELCLENGIENADRIMPGQKIVLP